MNENRIHDAIGELSEEILSPVATLREKKFHGLLKWAALAACFCLILALSLFRGDWRMEKSEADAGANLGVLEDALYSDQENQNEMAYGSAGSPQEAVFRAKVLKVEDAGLTVSPLEGEDELRSGDLIQVSLNALKDLPQFHEGDVVEIRYDGMIQETYPLRIIGTIEVKIVE